jgi:hypothetical protein
MKKFLLFLGGIVLAGSLALAATVEDSTRLPQAGAGGNNLVTNLNSRGSSITATWSANDSTYKEIRILIFPETGVADTFSIYLITDPDEVKIRTFRTVTFDSIHLIRPDSSGFLSAYTGWE